MKWRKKSTRTIAVESYVTLRSEWPQELGRMVAMEYNARGLRVVDGRAEWQYFADEIEAKKWADAIHSPNDPGMARRPNDGGQPESQDDPES